MSLIRFLTAGSRGLAHGAPPLGKYRLPHGRVFPEFGKQNPFDPKPSSPSQPPSAVAAGDTAKAALTQAAPPLPVDSRPAGATPFASAAAPVSASPALWRLWLAGVSAFPRHWASRCASLLKSVLAWRPWRSRGRSRAGHAAPTTTGPVQGELRLENVRVVRNDLSDTDYEVVLADTTTASPVRREGGPGSAASRGSLNKLAERLFGDD